jgi:hypothetical protein
VPHPGSVHGRGCGGNGEYERSQRSKVAAAAGARTYDALDF